MRSLAPLLLCLFLLLPSCKALTQAWETAEDAASDAWIATACAIVGAAVGGPIGAGVGAGIGSAFHATRARLYSQRDLAAAFQRGELFGRQAVNDLLDAARGERIESAPEEPPTVPWYRSTWAILAYVVFGALTLNNANFIPRAIFGPHRLRTLAHMYVPFVGPPPAV